MARKRILCIEDDRETATLIVEALTDRGFALSVANDGREGLDAILQQAPDLVLCDISLPFMSGFDVQKRMTEIAPDFGHMPFVFLTALGDRENELKDQRLGTDDYITKPVDFDVLASVVNARLTRAPRKLIGRNPVNLNEREIQTLTWSARGKTSIQIAKILGFTKRNVDFHLDNARHKLGAATRIQAVIKAKDRRLIEP